MSTDSCNKHIHTVNLFKTPYECQNVYLSTLTLEILIPPSFFLPLFTAAYV